MSTKTAVFSARKKLLTKSDCDDIMYLVSGKHAGMAELADAPDSGSGGGNFVEVQVLLPAPKKRVCRKAICSLFSYEYKLEDLNLKKADAVKQNMPFGIFCRRTVRRRRNGLSVLPPSRADL